MWPYFVMFLIPALAAVGERRRPPGESAFRKIPLEWLLSGVLLVLLVGFRYEVGGDWGNYLRNFEESAGQALTYEDPAYRLLERISLELGWGIVGVNVIAATMFTAGLVYFCRDLPRPWLALTVAVPYLVLIVAMGYTRQGIAIGCAMVGLVGLGRQRTAQFLGWVVLAALFHRSAVLLLPIAALATTKRRVLVVFWVSMTTAVAYFAVLQDSVDDLRQSYIEAEYESEGALVRLLMNTLPALLLLLYRRRFVMTPAQRSLWIWFAVISVVLTAILFVSPSSTAVDRVALYMIPLQMVVFSHVPDVIGLPKMRQAIIIAVVLYYATVQTVWLNFAVNAEYWIPYKFYPAEAWL